MPERITKDSFEILCQSCRTKISEGMQIDDHGSIPIYYVKPCPRCMEKAYASGKSDERFYHRAYGGK